MLNASQFRGRGKQPHGQNRSVPCASIVWLARAVKVERPSVGRLTTYDYYPDGMTNAGQVKGVQDANGNWTYFDYTPAGQLFRRWGVTAYPIQQLYDQTGHLTNLMTFRTAAGAVNWASPTWPNPPAGDVTQLIYDDPSGLLERKIYPDAGNGAKETIYSYDSGNFLGTKTNEYYARAKSEYHASD